MVNQAYGNAGRKVTGAELPGINFFLGFTSYLPLLASTLILLLGWIATLYPDVSTEAQGNLLPMPVLSPVAYGFLGAYFFAINLLFGRYVRGDLTPKAYMHIVTRVLITEVVAWAVSPVFGIHLLVGSMQINAPEALLLATVFLIGIFPESGIALLHDFVTKPPTPGATFLTRPSVPTLHERLPLSLLEGVNLYDRARLLEEGIESLQNLVHHSPIDLMLRTSLPTHQIVDLYDQALLYLHLGKEESQVEADREILQSYGIRTATDLYEVSQQVRRRGDAETQLFFGDCEGVVCYPPAAGEPKPFARGKYVAVPALFRGRSEEGRTKWRDAALSLPVLPPHLHRPHGHAVRGAPLAADDHRHGGALVPALSAFGGRCA